MKKSLIVAFLLASVTVASAQNRYGIQTNELMRVIAILTVMIIIVLFILTFLKYILESRLKNRIIDKGITENLATSILQTTKKDDKLQTIKWFCLLAATGAGLMWVYYTLPLDIHSVAIMAFSLSLGYLGYYFILKQQEKQQRD
jgi:hypothetical protein